MIRRNAALLPAYTLVLGLIALFGYMARAVPAVNAGVKAGGNNPQLSVPLLFQQMFPSWFAGIGDAAIVRGHGYRLVCPPPDDWKHGGADADGPGKQALARARAERGW